jgi:trans-aconitate methyltransferase
MNDPMARGGVRRYLDTVTPEEYIPDTGEVNLKEMTLTGLADLFGSDKGNVKHCYTDVYERIVAEMIRTEGQPRHKCVFEIAEAGVACGASLHMWAHYLPASNITGFDIREECASLCKDLPNVDIYIQDLCKNAPPDDAMYDLFIDDASHISEQMVSMFGNVWDQIRPGGYYVIEDLKCTYNDAYTRQFREHFDANAFNSRQTIMTFVDNIMRNVDARSQIAEFSYYPQLLVIRKGET